MSGLPTETFAFLGDLSVPRDKAWFEANRHRYEAHLLAPMRDLVATVGPRLAAPIPDLEWRPEVNKSLTRIHRDMRFARGVSPYKDNMLALFYRTGRKKDDPQLFVGVRPGDVWVGLYLAPNFLAAGSPMAKAVAKAPGDIVALGRTAGLGRDLTLGACRRYGAIDRLLDGGEAGHYLAGPHLCALREFTPKQAAAPDFFETAADVLERLVPLWRAYLGS